MNLVKLEDIIEFLRGKNYNFTIRGDLKVSVYGFSAVSNYKKGTLTWVKSIEKKDIVSNEITACIVEKGIEISARACISVKNSKAVFFEIIEKFFSEFSLPRICNDSTIETADIGENCSIGHHCYIGKNVKIGNNVTIKNNVSIECPATIGNDSTIYSGVVIGTDGFGYYQDDKGNNKHVPHFGGVRIGKNVEIGANTCIDRGTIDDTCVGDNVKIDNLCHIAHNVSIGENSLVIALSMLAGSSRIGTNVYIAPGSLIKNQILVDDYSFVGMGTVVLSDVEKNKVVIGTPARVLRDNT